MRKKTPMLFRARKLALRGIPPLLAVAFLLPATVARTPAGEEPFIKPSPRDKCPVCGMFVSPYPEWIARMVFKDGSHAFFDGARDMLRYWTDMSRYSPARTQGDVDAIYVTDYYDLSPCDGKLAFFVWNSDVLGPMGKEFIPFNSEADAKVFMKDHRGEKILRFDEAAGEIGRLGE